MVTTTLAIAALGAAATAAAATASGDASHALHAIAPGLKIALAHVPGWTHAYQVLTERLSALEKDLSSGSGLANAGRAAGRAISHAFGHGR